tara:strand:- start:1430 stop:1585 length:156 start_codon:yes stop_codon:yes gene_type:complete
LQSAAHADGFVKREETEQIWHRAAHRRERHLVEQQRRAVAVAGGVKEVDLE